MAVIGSVIWAPESPIVGDSVKIDVCGPGGQPYANLQQEYVAIDGVAGSQQYVQFVWPGVHQITVTAVGSDGAPEQNTISITVAAPQSATTATTAATRAVVAAPGQPQAPAAALLEAEMNVQILTVAPQSQGEMPYAATFALQPVSALVTPPPSVAPGSPVPAAGIAPVLAATHAAEPMITTALPRPETGSLGAETAISSLPTQFAPPNLAPLQRFEWDFGDGSPSVKTITPQAAHDFGPALGTVQEFRQFHVTITDVTAGTPSYTRTLSVMNAYVTCKKRGYVVPEVTVQGWARKVGTNFVGTAVISNREPVDLALVSRQLIPVLADPTIVTVPSPLESLGTPVTVPASGSVSVQVIAPFSVVPDNALGFSAVFTDQAVTSATVAAGPGPVRILQMATGVAGKPAGQPAPPATTTPAGRWLSQFILSTRSPGSRSVFRHISRSSRRTGSVTHRAWGRSALPAWPATRNS